MSNETTPDTTPAPEPPPAPRPKSRPKSKAKGATPRPTSPAKIKSNCENSLKSTGPITPRGKAISARNSLKHGFCANVVDVPGEDPALFQARFDAWRPGLNPREDEFGDYLLTVVVRKSLNLDRLHVARAARLADRARSAAAERAARRAAEVHERLELIPDDCGTAVPKLRATTEGCRALIDEWERLEAPLLWPPHWDLDDAHRAVRLQGRSRIARKEAPNVLVVPTDWIDRHRRVAAKLKENEFGPACDPARRYYNEAEHDRDKEDLPRLEEGSRQGVAWLQALIEAEKKHLREHMETLKDAEAAEGSEAAMRARLDPSDEGKLLHRYEMDNERGLLKLASAVQGRAKESTVDLQVKIKEDVTSSPSPEPTPRPVPADPRNEATATAPTHPKTPIRAVEGDGIFVPPDPDVARDRSAGSALVDGFASK